VLATYGNIGLIGTPGAQGFGVGICPPDELPSYMIPMDGTFDSTSANYGNYTVVTDGSVMVYIPRFYFRIGHASNPTYGVHGVNSIDIKGVNTYPNEANANADGYAMHRAFWNGGAVKSGFFVDKYRWSLSNYENGVSGIASSVKNGNPISSAVATKKELKTISAVASDAGSNSYKITATGHGVAQNTTVRISGTGIALLDGNSFLINYTRTISNIQSAGTTATVITTEEHGLENGDSVTISGTGVAAYNITAAITKVDATTFTYTIASTTDNKSVGSVLYVPGANILRIKVTGATGTFTGSAVLDKRTYAGSFSNCISNSQTPTDTYGGAWAVAKSRGNNFAVTANFMYDALAKLSMAHGQASSSTTNCAWYSASTTNFPKGMNTSGSLRDTNDNTCTFSAANDGYWANRSEACKVGSGVVFAKTTHNGQGCGVADINGNQWEIAQGLSAIAAAKNITGISQANPGVVTITGHGYSTNDYVMILSAGGMTQVNNKIYKITVLDPDTFSIGVDTTGYTAYTSGGTVTRGAYYLLHENVDLKTVTGSNSSATTDQFADAFLLDASKNRPVTIEFNSNGIFDQRYGNSTNAVFDFSTDKTSEAYKRCNAGLPAQGGVSTGGSNLFGVDYFYQYVRDELCPIRFGGWDNGANAGVWTLSLNYNRTNSATSVSGRSCLYV